jgi:hypothetical protein
MNSTRWSLFSLFLCILSNAALAQDGIVGTRTPLLWRDPGTISERDLTYGPGSANAAPLPPFTFVAEEERAAYRRTAS